MIKSTKVFGLHSPADLLFKLKYDVDRVSEATFSKDVRYAAMDCAVDSLSLIDWTLESVSPQRREQLCGGPGRKKVAGFIETNADIIPHLEKCQQIANSAKHLVLTRMPDDPALQATHSVLLHFNAASPETTDWGSARAVAYIVIDGVKTEAGPFFRDVQRGWAHFLAREGLLRDSDPAEVPELFA